MPLEVLILLVCISGDGCPQAARQYYNTNPTLKQKVRMYRGKVEKAVGKEAAILMGSSIAAASGQPFRVRVKRNFQLVKDKDKYLLEFGLEF